MFKSLEGNKVPQVTFMTRSDGEFKKVSTDDIFKGKSIILFALPGAFTPTCSSTHLPGYNQLASTFKKNGIDNIICLSVNDAFVMESWGADQESENITLLPDGNGEFSEGMGLLVDKSDIGFGKRSWRYSMHVEDGVIKKMFIEPNEPGDPFKVSDAETMLSYLAPKAELPKAVSIISKPGCPFCDKAKKTLIEKDIQFEEIVLGRDATTKSLLALSGKTTVPQIFIEGKHIGGSDDLDTFFK